MTKYYKATDSSGRVHTRSTASRTYSHAVTCGKGSQWCGRYDLAEATARKGGYNGTPEILQAVEIDAREYRAILAADTDRTEANRREAVRKRASTASWAACNALGQRFPGQPVASLDQLQDAKAELERAAVELALEDASMAVWPTSYLADVRKRLGEVEAAIAAARAAEAPAPQAPAPAPTPWTKPVQLAFVL